MFIMLTDEQSKRLLEAHKQDVAIRTTLQVIELKMKLWEYASIVPGTEQRNELLAELDAVQSKLEALKVANS